MPNPIDEMTEEQKEYETMKLVNMLDKLSRYCIPLHFCLVSKNVLFLCLSLQKLPHRTATLEIHVDWNRLAQAAPSSDLSWPLWFFYMCRLWMCVPKHFSSQS